ncbi:hypothetical protein M0R45_027968 [Rubus argutus]|uniref:TF-B3 domain-containing protein n=1 Tax=Rubus argutus TaxID=59490 RepID=A0AAW1W474_RUBAR
MASRIHLRDLKMTKYSKSFDKILVKAKKASTNQEEQLQFVANTVLNRLFSKQSKKCKKSNGEERHTRTDVYSQIRQMIPKRSRSNLDKPEARKSETSENQNDEKAREESTKAADLVIPFPPQEVSLELNKGKEESMTNEDSPTSSGNHDQTKRKRDSSDDQDEDDEYKKKRKQKARKPRRELASPLTSEPPEMALESNKVKKVMTHNKDSPSSSGNHDQRKRKRERSDDQDEDNDHKKKARKARSLSPSETPEMPQELKNRVEALNAFQIEFVIQKTITSSDLRTGQTRLTFPQNQVRADAQDFRKELDKQFEEYANKDHRRKEKGPKGVMCKLIEPCLQVNNLRLIKWYYNSCCSYVLNGGWNRTCSNEDNGLTEDDLIQVWSFRVRDNEADNEDQGKLWFALVNKGKDHANASSTNEESSMPRKQSD